MFNQKEEDIVFETFTKFPFWAFQSMLFTLKPLSDNERFIGKVQHFTKLAYYTLCLILFPVAVVLILSYAVVQSDEFVEALSAVPNSVTVVLIAVKGYITFVRREQIWQMLQELKSIFEDRPYDNVKLKVKEHLDNYQKVVKPYAGIILFTYIPIVMPMLPYLITGKMKLTVDYWYPFDPYDNRVFIFVLIWVDWIAWNSLATLLAADCLLFALIALTVMELDILKRDLMAAMNLPDSQRTERTRSLIDRHNQLLNLCGDLNKIYSPTFLASFVITSFSLCLVAFQLSTGEADLEAYMFYIPYLAMLSGQVYLLCVFGQDMIDATQAISDGIYESGWEDTSDENFKKHLILIIQRSQKANRLTAMDFAEVSLSSFTTVSLLSKSLD